MLYGRARVAVSVASSVAFPRKTLFAVDVEIEDLSIISREQYGADGK
jgi:hypothetical protein